MYLHRAKPGTVRTELSTVESPGQQYCGGSHLSVITHKAAHTTPLPCPSYSDTSAHRANGNTDNYTKSSRQNCRQRTVLYLDCGIFTKSYTRDGIQKTRWNLNKRCALYQCPLPDCDKVPIRQDTGGDWVKGARDLPSMCGCAVYILCVHTHTLCMDM